MDTSTPKALLLKTQAGHDIHCPPHTPCAQQEDLMMETENIARFSHPCSMSDLNNQIAFYHTSIQ